MKRSSLLIVVAFFLSCATTVSRPARFTPVAAQSVEGNVTVNGVRLHYLQWGAPNKPVILILTGTGGLGGVAQQWRDFAEQIKGTYTVFAPEMRGTAQSEWRGPYTWKQIVDDIDAFIEHFHLSPVIVIGHSAGAHWGNAYAALHPEKVSRYIAVDPGGDPWHRREHPPVMPTFKSAADAFTFAKERWGISSSADETLRLIIALGLRKLPDGTLTWTIDPLAIPSWIPSGEQTQQFLKQIRVPTLIIRGAISPWPHDVAIREAAEIHGAQLVEVPAAGHVVHLSNPAEFLRVTCEFLQVSQCAARERSGTSLTK